MAEHYFTAEPSSAPNPRTVRFTLDGYEWTLAGDAGVFSGDRLDSGTEVLLRTAPGPRDGARLLDLGCGYGPIACVLARRAPASSVWAVDVNERALALTRANAAALGVGERVRVSRPEDVSAEMSFDEIWSNPPIRVGKQALHGVLLRWLPRLAPEGVAWLVVGRNLGADSLQRWLAEQGYEATRQASRRGFRVLRVAAGP